MVKVIKCICPVYIVKVDWLGIKIKAIGGQTAEARRIKILKAVEQKPQSQRVKQNETAKDCVPDEGTR